MASLSAPTSSQTSVSSGNSQPAQAMSKEELAKAISAVSAESISTLAQCVAGTVMGRLKIDVEFDAQGRACYKPGSPLMKWLKPQIEKALQEAFSNPAQFLETGVTLFLFKADGTGLLDKVDIDPALHLAVQAAKKRLIGSFDLESLELASHFTCGVYDGTLQFSNTETMNGNVTDILTKDLLEYEEWAKACRC